MPNPAMDTGMPDVLFELDNAEESLVLLWNTPKSKRQSPAESPKQDPSVQHQLSPSSPRRRISTPKQVIPTPTCPTPKQSTTLSPRRRVSTPKERISHSPASPKRFIISPTQLAPLSPRRRLSTPKESPASPKRSIIPPTQLAPLSPRRRISTPTENTPVPPDRSVISPRQRAPLSPGRRISAPKIALPASPRGYATTPRQATPLSPKTSISPPQPQTQFLTPRTAVTDPNPDRSTSPLVSSDENLVVSPRRLSARRDQTADRSTTPLMPADSCADGNISPSNNSALRRPTFFSAGRRSSAASRRSSFDSPQNLHPEEVTSPTGRRSLLSSRKLSPKNQDAQTPGTSYRRASKAAATGGKRPSFLSRRSPAPDNYTVTPRTTASFRVPGPETPATPASGRRQPSLSTRTPTVTPRNSRFSLLQRTPAPRTPKETSTSLSTPGGGNNFLGRSVSKIEPIFNAVASAITTPAGNPMQPLRRSVSMRNNNKRTPRSSVGAGARRMSSFKSPSTATPIAEAEFIAAQLKEKAAFQKAEAADLEEELEAHRHEAAVMEAEADKILCEVRRASQSGARPGKPVRRNVTVVKPFALSSFRKHEEATRRREARVEDQERALDRMRKFKARPMPTFYRR